jgi:hypothetical protein
MYYENMIFKRERKHCLDSFGSGDDSVIAFCEYDNEPSDTTRGGGFLDQLGDC